MLEVKTPRRGIVFHISEEDADLLVDRSWSRGGTYIICHKTGERLHRVILERKLGRVLRTGEIPDHRDLNKMNNTRDNIRLANGSKNMMNRPLGKNNTTGFYGLDYSEKHNAWRACVYVSGKRHDAGYYREKTDAAIAYNHLCLELHGEFATFNDVPGWRDIHPVPIQRPKQYKNTKGYCLHKDMRKYMAYIRYEGKTIHLGYYNTESEARAAYVAKALELYGANAYQNEVTE